MPLHEFTFQEQERPVAMVNEWGEISYDREENTNDLTTWLFDADSFVPTGKIIDGKTYSIINDHIGRPTDAYDENGNKVWCAEYDIYGRRAALKGGQGFCPITQQGQWMDVETGLYYNRFRYFSSEEGLYLNQDSIRCAGENLERLWKWICVTPPVNLVTNTVRE